LIGVEGVVKMMRRPGAVGERGLGGADVHAAIELEGITVYDFAGEALGEREGEVAFAGCGGAGDANQRKRRIRGERYTYECNLPGGGGNRRPVRLLFYSVCADGRVVCGK
jgi:hypothetical protein